MAQDYPLLNGYAPSWADISTTFMVGGGSLLDMIDYAAISWTDTVEEAFQLGAGGRPMKRTVGQNKAEASVTLYRSGLKKLETALAAVAPQRGNQRRISLVSFKVLIQHIPPGVSDTYQVELRGCRLLERAGSHAEGTDADKIECKLGVMNIVTIENGQEIVLI